MSLESYLTELYERDPPARITANRLFGTGTLQLEWSTFDISQIYRMPRSDTQNTGGYGKALEQYCWMQ